MLKFRFNKEKWGPGLSDWDPEFDPTKFIWVIEKGRFFKGYKPDKDEFIDMYALDSPGGEWMRIGACMVTLEDCINLYDEDFTVQNPAYDEDGNFIEETEENFIV